MPMYLAVAYRWGWTNCHHYFVLCSADLEKVRRAAEQAWTDRDGKYGVVVLEMDEEPTMAPEKRVFYFPSVMGEKYPSENARTEAFRSLGQRVFSCIGEKKTLRQSASGEGSEFVGVSIPNWLNDEARAAAAMHGLQYLPLMRKKEG